MFNNLIFSNIYSVLIITMSVSAMIYFLSFMLKIENFADVFKTILILTHFCIVLTFLVQHYIVGISFAIVLILLKIIGPRTKK